MPNRYTDEEISALISEVKPIPADYQSHLVLSQKRGHKSREMEVEGADGNKFVVKLRQNDFNVLDFSIILGVVSKDFNVVFRLRRYNGKSHEHTNRVAGNSFYDFHVHTASERYQDLGAYEDHFAEVTDRYSDMNSALDCMIGDCGFKVAPSSQTNLFEGTKI